MGLVWLVIILVAIIALAHNFNTRHVTFSNYIQEAINLEKMAAIEMFTSKLKFEPLPSEIDVTNEFECTTSDPKLCKMDDMSSCFGCKSLISHCVHFKEDIKYINDGEMQVLPKNETENDGYCLSIKTLADACNPYHGDLVLVSVNKHDSALICMCRNPGFIGNDEVLGACNTPYICNGKVEYIDKPLADMKCSCVSGNISVTVNGIPQCREMMVSEYNNYGDRIDDAFISKDYFSKEIAQNFNGRYLRNPCKYCAVTGVPLNGYLIRNRSDVESFICAADKSGYGVPFRRDPEKPRLLKGDYGPDGILAMHYTQVFVYGEIYGPYGIIETTYGANKSLYSKMFPNWNTSASTIVRFNMSDLQLKYPFCRVELNKVPLLTCVQTDPFSYDCFYRLEHDCPKLGTVTPIDMRRCANSKDPSWTTFYPSYWKKVSALNYDLFKFPLIQPNGRIDLWHVMEPNNSLFERNDDICGAIRLIGYLFTHVSGNLVNYEIIRASSKEDWFRYLNIRK